MVSKSKYPKGFHQWAFDCPDKNGYSIPYYIKERNIELAKQHFRKYVGAIPRKCKITKIW
jgi:hypothetical protein